MKPRLLEIRQGVLNKNDALANQLRQQFVESGIVALNLVSSPGTGKTMFLEKTLSALINKNYKPVALVGDLETDNDAKRLKQSGAPVRQITTAGNCHLEADMVSRHLDGWNLADYDFLFIENVGNLVCPSSYDLGEALRVVMLSVTEGEDKPLKYPPMFNSSDVAIITKIDLAQAVEFDSSSAHANINAVHPSIPIYEVSAKTGQGMEAWLTFLEERHKIQSQNQEYSRG